MAALQAGLGACAFLLVYLPDLPPVLLVAVGWTVLSGGLARLPGDRYASCMRTLRGSGWATTAGGFIAALWLNRTIDLGDVYYAWIAWLTSASLLVGSGFKSRQSIRWLKVLAAVWAMAGNFLWLGAAYSNNRALAFHLGLLATIALLVVIRLEFHLSPLAIQAAHAALGLLIMLPIVDLGFRWADDPPAPTPSRPPLVGIVPGRDPNQFAEWWRQYLDAWEVMARDVFVPDTEGVFRFRLKPGSVGHLMASTVSINREGFRGREIAAEKGRAYRIVALGESTTFGCTLQADDRPWPEMLESMIRTRSSLSRPVEVINAGVPAYSLSENVRRFRKEILPLQPDLIISYHGLNGFLLVDEWLRPAVAGPFPAYRRRPLVLLARLEYRLKILWHRVHSVYLLVSAPPPSTGLSENPYTQAYRELIRLSKANGIPLVLCTFSMAVNQRSPAEEVDYYRSVFPQVRAQIRANQIHSALLDLLAREDPGLDILDTRPGLDGRPEFFIDLVHLTEEGRQRLAETILTGIMPTLTKALSSAAEK